VAIAAVMPEDSANSTMKVGSGAAGGAFVAYMAGPEGSEVVTWLSSYLGAVGFVTVVFSTVFAIGWWITANYFAKKQLEDEKRWGQRFDQLRADAKAAYLGNAEALSRVTDLLTAAAGMQTQSRPVKTP
tara:strand:- start:3063 stop:3449 length:387 start_codon:yes stop_codon:yes gene_type:complete